MAADWLQQRRGANTIPFLGERITARLVGQQLNSFSRLIELVNRAVTLPDDILRLPSVRAGIQQALLAAVADSNGRTPLEIAKAEYELSRIQALQPAALVLDVANDVATAERIAEMIALAPDGLGYRLVAGEAAQSIGSEAEFLQQFVRELGAYLSAVMPDKLYQPSLLLRLNGALGDLTIEPRQHVGKVLGHIVGLEQASHPWPLWVADPILLNDLTQQAATLKRLRKFMRQRDMAVKLVVETGLQNLGDLDVVLQSEACDAVLVEWGGWADLDQMLRAAANCAQHGVAFIAADTPSLTPAQLTLLLDLFGSVGNVPLVVSVRDSSAGMPVLAKTLISRRIGAILPQGDPLHMTEHKRNSQ